MSISNRHSHSKSFSQVAKHYIPAKRADKPHIIFSILALASEKFFSVMSGTQTQHEFGEIFHPYLYPDYIVYQYINKDSAGTRQIECAFIKSDFSADEWSAISEAVSDRRAYINGAVKLSSVIGLSHGALH
jgi:hypothetical protein